MTAITAIRPLPGPPRERLAREATRFTLDQAAHLLAPAGDVLALRYRTVLRLGYPMGEVAALRGDSAVLAAPTFGLVGAGGVLPRHFTALVGAEQRKQSRALHAFLDLGASRFTGLYVKAGDKYRPTRDPRPAEAALAALIGLATPHLADRIGLPMERLLYHAGNLASRSRSAARLQAMLEEETGVRVEIQEFTGGWIRLPPEERTRLAGGEPRGGRGRGLGGQHAVLGGGAVAGTETWDSQARFVIRLGPLGREGFESLLPGTPRHDRILSLARLFAGLDTGFAINPVLAAGEIPPLALGRGRLGWSTWLTAPRPRRRDGAEPHFDGSTVTSR
ncbi:type VI secretion system baseplate subunit TssG [Belnapia sp. T6]|uniref:Type VI secretion system baseplate subunit TssG n=1 Tax=Belnapia mucosa TaxID=2804532 RepID=A0ABS1V994_9PROT|nr:type VI secretion system baseplate subunit TssG [Belnapia mucosa]MBL6456908.1 type VI secretion system baseplate subunit TssG [Belnapia mucosa]